MKREKATAAKRAAGAKTTPKNVSVKRPAKKAKVAKKAVKKAAKKAVSKRGGSSLEAIDRALLEYALSFPEATEDFPWGERVMKVKKKVFVFFGRPGEGLMSIATKLPKSGAAALMAPFASMTGYGLGKAGWVTSTFSAKDEVPVPLLREWIAESYRAVAPKTLVKALDAVE